MEVEANLGLVRLNLAKSRVVHGEAVSTIRRQVSTNAFWEDLWVLTWRVAADRSAWELALNGVALKFCGFVVLLNVARRHVVHALH